MKQKNKANMIGITVVLLSSAILVRYMKVIYIYIYIFQNSAKSLFGFWLFLLRWPHTP